ncbi:MAG: ribonuclease R [Melioribacteraceae bacterium]|nr:ribonuclease R [Melioribacteraceae bacterium]
MKKEIKAYFKNHPSISIKAVDLAKKLRITEEYQYAELKSVLFRLYEEEYLEKIGKRYQLRKAASEKLIGNVQLVNDGDYAFVILKNSSMEDIFVVGKNLNTAFDGDLVEVVLLNKKSGKSTEGKIVEIVERKRDEVVGILKKQKSYFFVIPDESKIHRHFYINEKKLGNAKDGDKVVVHKITWKAESENPEGEIKEVLGKAGSYDAEIASIARQFGLSYKFPKAVLKQANEIPTQISEEEISKRIDLREKNIFTIDPDDAKDFDDAVSVDILPNGNYSVGIHIADVSHFIPTGSPIYNEALERGTSVYIVGKVIPMLPEKLSNNICSLVPFEDRLTYSVLVEMSPLHKIISYEIKKSVINSKRRFTYDEAQNIIESGKGDFNSEIALLFKISQTLRNERIKKGSINFFSPEVVFKLDKNGTPIDIQIKQVRESNNLIEEFMLLANKIIAKHIKVEKNKIIAPFVYRVHDLPDKEKVGEFARFVQSLGYSFDPNATNKSKQFQKLLDQVKGTEEDAVVNEIAIRSMAKAVYSTENIGHYGLGFKDYTHFTSPIRRFPDLIVHKLIFNFIENKREKNFSLEELTEICNHASARERNAVNAERLSVKLKQIEYLKGKVGSEFHAIVSGITHFGIFVELNQTLAEGLIRLRDMDDDYYIFDEKNYSVVGKRNKKRIRLGDKVLVKLINVDEQKRALDFMLLG